MANYRYAEEVTPTDTANIDTPPAKALYIGGSGDIALTLSGMEETESVVFSGLNAGEILEVRAKKVWSTDTTATDIVALY